MRNPMINALQMINENTETARVMFVRSEKLDKHFTSEYNSLLNVFLQKGEVYTTKLSNEVARRVLTQMLFSGMFN